MTILSMNQEHKHTARLMAIIYEHIEKHFGDSEFGLNTEYDVAIKLLGRIGFNLSEEGFGEKVKSDVNDMINSFGR